MQLTTNRSQKIKDVHFGNGLGKFTVAERRVLRLWHKRALRRSGRSAMRQAMMDRGED